MHSGPVTTPFGRRPVTLALVKSQLESAERKPAYAVDKWKVFRDVCAARDRLGLPDRALTVLNALLSFYPEAELSGAQSLVVFPSNAQLAIRAHGIAETTLRRHLAALVEAGLIQRQDSPNGKRYAHRGKGGTIEAAFGFNLVALLSRAGELAALAQQVAAERLAFRRAKEALTICRRDVRKLITAAIEEGADGNWAEIEATYIAILARLPRQPAPAEVDAILDEMGLLREEVLNRLEMQLKAQNTDASHGHFERHIQNSKSDSINELEPVFEKEQGETPNHEPTDLQTDLTTEDSQTRQAPGAQTAEAAHRAEVRAGAAPELAGQTGPSGQREPMPPPTHPADDTRRNGQQSLRPGTVPAPARNPGANRIPISFPIGMVLRACPQIADYGPGGTIGNWRDLMQAAVVVRSMLGVSPSAYEEACATMGPENAAVMMACILERAGHITSAGGYVRSLTRRAADGDFSLGPMIMALMKVAAGSVPKSA